MRPCFMCRTHMLDQNGRCPHCDGPGHPVQATCNACRNAIGWDGCGPTSEPRRRDGR